MSHDAWSKLAVHYSILHGHATKIKACIHIIDCFELLGIQALNSVKDTICF